ncbi:MAG: hypothetical protein RQ748_11855 [Elusimicrobiales bacterium]|nr:hypothetical protein [Elusimicrobiales bacterium]
MRKLGLIAALCLTASPARADILGLIDRGMVNPRPSSSTVAGPEHHVVYDYSVIPGGTRDFGFGFARSSAVFQWSVDVTVEIDAGKAGHNHNDPPPRLFYYPNWPDEKTMAKFDGVILRSAQLAQDQSFTVHMAPVDHAVSLKVVGAFTKNFYGRVSHPTLTYYLDVRTPGLVRMQKNERLYRLTGVTALHPEIHYGSTATVAALTDLAGAWKTAYPYASVIEIAAISLPWGGAVDAKGDWKTMNIHHAYGIAADIGRTGLSAQEKAGLIKLLCGGGFYVYNMPESGAEHYHAVHREEFRTLKELRWPVRLPAKAEGAVYCCSAKAGSPAWRKCAGF